MATERTVAIWESPYDLRKLGDNGFDFCIAKSVIDSTGKLTFNMVWQSKALGPIIDVSWTTQYALNWTVDVPTGGARVKEGGFWHPCNPGDVFDLDKTGLFHPSTVPAKAGFLKLGNNGYQYPGKSGIHVIVGVKNLAGKYDAIYVDPTELALGMSAWYQPQEKAQWWYEKGVWSSSMISGARGRICDYDLTTPNPKTNTYYVSTTYAYDKGLWTTSLDEPPSQSMIGVLGSDLMVAGHLNANASDTVSSKDFDQVRMEMAEILSILKQLGAKDGANGGFAKFIPKAFYGLVGFASGVAMGHGGERILEKLKALKYDVTITYDNNRLVATLEINPPPGTQDSSLVTGGVPTRVTDDWNSAVNDAAEDHPTNQGLFNSRP